MKRLMIVVNDLAVGGAQQAIANSLTKLGKNLEIKIITLFPFNTNTLYANLENSHKVLRLNFKSLYNLSSWLSLAKEVKSYKPNLIMSHLYPANPIARLLGFVMGYRVLSFQQNTVTYSTLPDKWFDIFTMHLTPQVMAVSSGVKTSLIKECHLPASRIEVLHNPVEIKKQPEPKQKNTKAQIKLLTVCRLVPQKGLDFALEVAHVLDGYSKFRFVWTIVGDGPQYSDLLTKISNLNLSGKVILEGYQNPEAYYKRADVYINTSIREGLSLSLLEAASNYLPSVVSKVDGNDEIVIDNVSGYVVWQRDPKLFAKKIQALGSNPKLRKQFGQQAYTHSQNYSTVVFAKKFKRLSTHLSKFPNRYVWF